jgi:serine phosphatase RsbU (regulator of sigma subunit)
MANDKKSAEKDAKPSKKSLAKLLSAVRKNIKITWYLSLVTLSCITVVGGLTGRFAILSLNESKLKDTWAILYLEMENVAANISVALIQIGENYESTKQKDIPTYTFVYEGDPSSPLKLFKSSDKSSSALSKRMTVEDLGFDVKSSHLHQFASYRDRNYLVKRRTKGPDSTQASKDQQFLDLFPVTFGQQILEKAKANQSRTYIINRYGSVLFSTDSSLNREKILTFPIMNYFVNNPIASGQTEIEDENGKIIYAFFKEIPGTNLTLFSEVTRNMALAPVKQAEDQYWFVLAFAIIFAGVIVQVPLAYIKNPLAKLIAQTQRLSLGDFSIRSFSSGFGEVRILSESFGTMAVSLAERDRKIQALLVESQKKARLEKEMLIAKGIQENLLPEKNLPSESNVEVFTSYLPAEEVAGDWYYFHYNSILGETLIVISDVSGHGAGSSMFTGIIAEIFEDFLERNMTTGFPLAEFADVINRRLLKFGRGAWHSTLAVVKIKKDSDTAEYLNAGHTPLILKMSDAETKLVKLPSNPLGIDLKLDSQIKTVSFASGSIGLLYTDGLTEAKNNKNTAYGSKRLFNSIKAMKQTQCKKVVESVINSWRSHTGTTPQNDDICLIGFKKVG